MGFAEALYSLPPAGTGHSDNISIPPAAFPSQTMQSVVPLSSAMHGISFYIMNKLRRCELNEIDQSSGNREVNSIDPSPDFGMIDGGSHTECIHSVRDLLASTMLCYVKRSRSRSEKSTSISYFNNKRTLID